MSGNYCCSGQSEGEVSLRRLKNNFSPRCKTCRAVGLCRHNSSDVLRFAQVDAGKDWGRILPLHPHFCLTHMASRHKPSGRHPPSGHRCLPSESHGMVLPLPCCPAVTITHRCAPITPRSGENAFKSPLRRISQ